MKTPTWTIQRWKAPAPPDGLRQEKTWAVGGLSRQENIELITLANLGMTAQTIADFTGLTRGQVTYRLKYFGIRLKDFREGRGPIARLVFQRLSKPIVNESIHLARQFHPDIEL